jgi:hypothetical protein
MCIYVCSTTQFSFGSSSRIGVHPSGHHTQISPHLTILEPHSFFFDTEHKHDMLNDKKNISAQYFFSGHKFRTRCHLTNYTHLIVFLLFIYFLFAIYILKMLFRGGVAAAGNVMTNVSGHPTRDRSPNLLFFPSAQSSSK